MAWERGYYYRSRKVAGRVVRQYLGAGPDVERAAQLDALQRQLREIQAQQRRRATAQLRALEDAVKTSIDQTKLLARLALLAAGYHQHKQGEWRKKRG